MFEKEIEKYKDEEINSLMDIISYKSVSEDSENPNAPFGVECSRVLEHVLNLGRKMGFRTKNVDGYCGYIEFGEGDEMLGIIGHLDVVPAKIEDGWNTDPFSAVIKNGRIYGRGAIDDKGPVIASLYAMKFVADNFKVKKRVRLILGLNEEKDWKCINYYKTKEEFPTISFSPDADFPCIYAEKGIFNAKVKFNLDLGENVKIINVDCGNNAINVVPKYASIMIECDTEKEKQKYLNLKNLNVIEEGEKNLKIEAYGKSAHAAYPEQGENAITKLLLNLTNSDEIKKLEENGFFEISSPKYLGGEETIDESGKLTSNIAQIKFEDGKIELSINFRVPVNTTYSFIKDHIEALKNISHDLEVNVKEVNSKLYVPKESYLVKTLTGIFNEETGLNEKPISTGGGTYARAFENCVAFGAIMPGEEETYHQANEFIDIENMIKATKIYARAIYELTK